MFFTFQRQTQTEGVDRDSERTRTEHQTCVFKESPKNPHPSLQHHDTVTDDNNKIQRTGVNTGRHATDRKKEK